MRSGGWRWTSLICRGWRAAGGHWDWGRQRRTGGGVRCGAGPATPAPNPSAGAALPPPIPVPTRGLATRGMRFTSTSTHLTAVTALSVQAWATLQRQGWVSPLADQVAPEFRHEYDWMRWRMHARIPGYTGGYPMWFWLNRAGIQGSFGEANQVHVTAEDPPRRGSWSATSRAGTRCSTREFLHPAVCPVCTDPDCEDTIHDDPDVAYDQFAARLRPSKPGQAQAARLAAPARIRDPRHHRPMGRHLHPRPTHPIQRAAGLYRGPARRLGDRGSPADR